MQLQQVGITTARLDAELILEFTSKKTRTYLHGHSQDILPKSVLKKSNKLLKQRLKYIPIAYIIGNKEFYGHNFLVTSNVLIPRPESEAIVELVKGVLDEDTKTLIDVGTGSGCLGISIKIECPSLEVTLSDINRSALKIAKLNSNKLNAKVDIVHSDLLNGLSKNFDIIVANLPYVDKTWEVSRETKYEPNQALYASDGGLQLIKKLISTSTSKYLILESDPRQQQQIIEYAKKYSYKLQKKTDYVVCLKSN